MGVWFTVRGDRARRSYACYTETRRTLLMLLVRSLSPLAPAPPLGDRPPGEGERHQGEYRDDPS